MKPPQGISIGRVNTGQDATSKPYRIPALADSPSSPLTGFPPSAVPQCCYARTTGCTIPKGMSFGGLWAASHRLLLLVKAFKLSVQIPRNDYSEVQFYGTKSHISAANCLMLPKSLSHSRVFCPLRGIERSNLPTRLPEPIDQEFSKFDI